MKSFFKQYHSRQDKNSAKWLRMNELSDKIPKDCVPMTVADMEFFSAPEIIQGLKDYLDQTILGYTVAGDGYLNAIINHYKDRYHVSIAKDEIVAISGVVGGLYLAIDAFSKQGDGVIIFPPVYPPFSSSVENSKRHLMQCPLFLEDEKYQIDFEALENLAKDDKAKLIILCSPHNPSGRIWTKDELEKIAQIAKENDLIVISDEIHSDLVLQDHHMTSFFNLDMDVSDFAIILGSASKTYNLAGLQTAHALIKNKDLLVAFNQAMADIGSHGPNMLGLKATELAYTKADEWLQGAKEVVEDNMARVRSLLEKYPDLFWIYPSEATYLMWVSFEGFARKFDMRDKEVMHYLYDHAFIAQAGIEFGQEGKYFMRVNVAMPSHKLEENLNRLQEAIDKKINQ